MTETVSGATTRKGKAAQASPGDPDGRARLRMQRIHTTPGVHPYDQVTWERRDVVMTNWRDGSINFEQHGVEFPDFWSVNAANIVTTKYFRGAVGSPQREWSLKQLIDRVVGTYEKAGQEHGYFATEQDAEIFGHELRYALVHQIFSFNSPVWFNVGTTSPQQVSACQPYDALVSTPAGLVPIGKLVESDAVGTKVFDAHGSPRVRRRPRQTASRRCSGCTPKAGLRARRHRRSPRLAGIWRRYRSLRASRRVSSRGDKLRVAPARQSHGEAEIRRSEIAEAALAGWLQSDGFVGQYKGTNRSLTIEAMTVTDAELAWVTEALDRASSLASTVTSAGSATQDERLDCRRTRLYGERPAATSSHRWDLLTRGIEHGGARAAVHRTAPVVVAPTCAASSRPRGTSRRAKRSHRGRGRHDLRAAHPWDAAALLPVRHLLAGSGFKRDARARIATDAGRLRIQNDRRPAHLRR